MDILKLKSYIRLKLAKANSTFVKSKQAACINRYAEGKVSAYKDILDYLERQGGTENGNTILKSDKSV